MRITALIILALLMSAGAADAQKKGEQKKTDQKKSQTVTGYLVDRMCARSMVKQGPEKAMEKAKRHTRECNFHEDCAASGFGVMTGGKLVPFDADGDKKAMAYLKSITKEREIEVVVTGVMEGDTLRVQKIAGK